MKYNSKEALLLDIVREYELLMHAVNSIPVEEQLQSGVWGDNWNVRDLLAHLYEWHQLFLTWWAAGQRGDLAPMPAPGFKWNETPALNREIQRRYAGFDPIIVRNLLETSHGEILQIAESSPEPLLLNSGHFSWTGPNALVTYLAANSASHYRFAIKVLMRWRRQVGRATKPRGITTR